jgi:mono/diheme cytochrome c family protein
MRGVRLRLLLLFLVLGGCDQPQGQKLFAESCAACHGSYGRGDGAWAKIRNFRPPDLASEPVQKKTDEELKNIIRNGRPGTPMPPHDELSPEQLDSLLKFIRTL